MTFISTEQAAGQLGITAERVRQLIRSGRLPAEKVGGRDWLIKEEDLKLIRVRRHGRPPTKGA